jgi:hypothetical protein
MGLLFLFSGDCRWKKGVDPKLSFNLYDYERNAEMQNEYVLLPVNLTVWIACIA